MTEWRKSSRSNTSGGDCVEVGRLSEAIGIRDSKNPGRPHLSLTADAFASLLTRVQRGELDLHLP
ncbi:DUF397 domain-containing protein [Actinomadura scrupuli]|uniref:DUF397 domain-containing protein n=1 Tax=Actinomadura scrupuli TaxID=559629 RepID=UPI003D982E92